MKSKTKIASPFMSPGGISFASSANMELEVEWNPSQVQKDLQTACQVLADRGLKLSAKFAAEQLIGLPLLESSNDMNTSALSDDFVSSPSSHPAALYAKTLMDLGEYGHAAAVLSEPLPPVSSIESMPPPSPDLSPYAFYLRAYALYMDGERRKEQVDSDDKNQTTKGINPYISQLAQELSQNYAQLDAFGLHVYGMVLMQLQEHKTKVSAHDVLMESIQKFPYNWSAWLDLATVVLKEQPLEQTVEQVLGSTLSDNFMFHFFCAHLQAEHQSYAEALRIYERWMDPSLLGGSPYLATQAAVMHYHLREFGPATRLLQDLHTGMPYRLDSMDVYSNILYVTEDSVGLGRLAHTAVQVDRFRAETCCIIGNYYSLKQERAKAIQYFQRALKLDRSFTSAWTLMGHEYVEWKQTAKAMEAYRQAVQVNPSDYRAWYGLGQTYELLEMNLYALYYYKKAAQLRPFDARMWTAVGNAYSQLDRTGHAIRAYERALQQDDTEGVATQKLASLYRQQGSDEMAAQCYLQHLQNRYQVTHSDSKSEAMSLDALLVGIHVEAAEAEAILYLANYYRDNAEYDMCAMLASRLLEYPGPEKEDAKALLREGRSRKNTQPPQRTIHTRSQGPVFDFSP